MKINKTLALKLIKADKEKDVINILKSVGYWDDYSQWKPYGDIENNFSIIGNQQSNPESALVEKIINSIDAVLIKESLARGIHPESPEAPKDIKSAVQDFFHIYGGSIANIDSGQRTRLSEQIELVATGYKTKPTFTIIDEGEGQYPDDFKDTFLSLAKSNKIKIGFVQGKFNMGGSGVLQFCGNHNMQLIVSKRNADISDEDAEWGITLVRRQQPKKGYKSSMYTYLAPKGEILSFKADSLPVRPTEYPNAYGRDLKSGTLIKLYEYDLSTGLSSNIKFDLYYKLNELMPEIALPIKMYERREGYKGVTMQSTLNGLRIRLEDKKNKRIEEGFPTSFSFHNIIGELYVFKKGKARNYISDHNIIFTVNGQTHGGIAKRFFNRKNVGMGSLADSILVILNCDNMTATQRENLFMNSRDRLRSSKIRSSIESELEDFISSHKGLKELKKERRKEQIQETLEDQRPFKNAMEDIIGQSKVLASLFFGKGGELKNPLKFLKGSPKDKFTGKRFPTFFELITEMPKECQKGRRFRIQFATDAQNDYFSRENERGQLFVYHKNEKVDFVVNLWNGYATINLDLPKRTKVGDDLVFKTQMWDNSHAEPFEHEIQIKVVPKKETEPDSEETDRKPPTDKGDDKSLFSGTSGMPNIIEVRKKEWDNYGFTKHDCLEIINNGDLGFDFAINMDNHYLLNELLRDSDDDTMITKMKYKYAVSIIGMALIHSNAEDKSKDIMRVLSPVIVPLTMLDISSHLTEQLS